MSMYNLIEYSGAYKKASQEVCGNTIEMNQVQTTMVIFLIFLDDSNNGASFKFKQKITGQTGNGGTKMLKYWFH